MATIKDIAKKLNISVSTVSYALNGGPRPVPEEVRERVLQTAKELDYRPNRLARSLITGRSYTIGVVPTDPYTNLAFTPYFQGCFNGIVNEAELLDQDVLLFTRYDHTESSLMADTLLDGRADGLLFLAPTRGNEIFTHVRSKIPHVVMNGDTQDVPNFTVNNRSGVRQAVEHLFGLGHRRIAHIKGTTNLVDSVERCEAFVDTINGLNLSLCDEHMLQGALDRHSGYQAAVKLMALKHPPTGVFCANDEMAHGFILACRDTGVRIPHDVSLVGFDDAPMSAMTSPAVTTVSQPWVEMGGAATRALLSMIGGSQDVTGRQFETKLIVRNSTARPKEDN